MEFLHHYKDLILNIFIILIPLFFFKYTLIYRYNRWIYTLLMYLIFVIPLILTMNLPIKTEATVYDLRGIPLIIGSLYGGVYNLFLLFISLISYRYSLGGLNLIHYIVALLPTFIILFLSLKRFHSLSVNKKILLSILTVFFLRSTVLSIYLILGGRQISITEVFQFSLPVFITQSLIAGILVYLIEAIRKNYQMQQEIIETEKLRMVSFMAASVAHEIRNPLTAVRGFIQLLGVNDLSDDRRKFYSEICKDELDRAQKIISEYLTLAKPENQRLDAINLRVEFEYITSILGSYANYQNVQINNHMTSDIFILGDRAEFRQAIINFGKNSIESMSNGGVLELKYVIVNNMVELFIIDNGLGMTTEQVNRLGTPYYSTKEKGTGLGTMVSFNIIKKMSGKIQVTSTLGVGTTFKISFPLIEQEDNEVLLAK